MDKEKVCDEILGCDEKIRYVGIYDFGELYDKIQSGKKSLLSKEETELSYHRQFTDGLHVKRQQTKLEN